MGEVNVDHGWKPKTGGAFTPDAAALTTVTDGNVRSNSYIVFSATNGQAGELLRSKSCYVTGIADGSFTFNVSASGAGAPGADEIFHYIVIQNS